MRGFAALAHAVLDRDDTQRISEWDVPWDRSVLAGSPRIDPVSAFNLSAVWACETLIADSIASLPADTNRKRDDTREPTNPPTWVDTPNPYSTRVDFETQRLLSLLGWGNAYSLLVRRDGSADPLDPVVERWTVDPWTVECRRDGTKLVYTIGGNPVPAGNLQHIRGYTLPGNWKGMSVVEQARQSMGLGYSAEAFGSKFYENGIAPSGALEVPELPAESSRDVVDRLREQFAERYAGTGNAHKPVVLTGGTKWKQITVTPVDAEFLSTRQFQVQEIARWFRVPPHMIADVEKSTSWGTGIEQQTLGFAKFTLAPWIVRLEQADSLLLPRGQYLRFNLSAFVRADLTTRYNAYARGRQGGWLSANDVRALEDMAPLDENGDIYLQPLNMIEAGEEDPFAGNTNPDLTPDSPADRVVKVVRDEFGLTDELRWSQ